MTCTACGLVGHLKANRNCPRFQEGEAGSQLLFQQKEAHRNISHVFHRKKNEVKNDRNSQSRLETPSFRWEDNKSTEIALNLPSQSSVNFSYKPTFDNLPVLNLPAELPQLPEISSSFSWEKSSENEKKPRGKTEFPNFPKDKSNFLRVKENTAKYLSNLNLNSAYYDPKSRSMREDTSLSALPSIQADKKLVGAPSFPHTKPSSLQIGHYLDAPVTEARAPAPIRPVIKEAAYEKNAPVTEARASAPPPKSAPAPPSTAPAPVQPQGPRAQATPIFRGIGVSTRMQMVKRNRDFKYQLAPERKRRASKSKERLEPRNLLGIPLFPAPKSLTDSAMEFVFKGPINKSKGGSCWLDSILAIGLSLAKEICQYKVREESRMVPMHVTKEWVRLESIDHSLIRFYSIWLYENHEDPFFRKRLISAHDIVWHQFELLGFTYGTPCCVIDAFPVLFHSLCRIEPKVIFSFRFPSIYEVK